MKRLLITIVALLSALPFHAMAEAAASTQRPNVVFISMDDLNDWSGYAGHPDAITPNLDRLAREGVSFSRAHCQYPLCGPSRASVMSGMYFHDLKLPKTQAKDADVSKAARAKGSALLHDYFHEHGYKTMAVGKIQHRHVASRGLDLSGGRGDWDFNIDEKGERIRKHWDTRKTMTDWGPYLHDEAAMSDVKAAQWAVDRLEEKHDKPFMLMVGFLRPHVPWYVPQRYFDLYDKQKLRLPPYRADDLKDVPAAGKATINNGYPRTEWAIEKDEWRNIVHAYLASITFADAQLGKVLDAIDQRGDKDNTIIVLWSDHGYHQGEKNTFQKHTLWQRSTSVPVIIRAPGMKSNKRCDRLVQLMDLYPTLLDLCDLPANKKLKGRSLKPLLGDPDADWSHPAITFSKDGGASIYHGDDHLIEYGDKSRELYDLSKDPNEWNNLANDPAQRQRVQELSTMLKRHR